MNIKLLPICFIGFAIMNLSSVASAMTCPLGPEPIIYDGSFVPPDDPIEAADSLSILEFWEEESHTPTPLKVVAKALIEKQHTQFYIYSPLGAGHSLWAPADYVAWAYSSQKLLEPGYAEDAVHSLLRGESRPGLQWVSQQSRDRLQRALHAFVEGKQAEYSMYILEARYRELLEKGSSEDFDQRFYQGLPKVVIPKIELPPRVREAVEGVSHPLTAEQQSMVMNAFSLGRLDEQRRAREAIFDEGPSFRLPIWANNDVMLRSGPRSGGNVFEDMAMVEKSVAIHVLKTLLHEALVRRQLHFEAWYGGKGVIEPSKLSLQEEDAVYMVSFFPELRSYFSDFQKMNLSRALQYGFVEGDQVSPRGISLKVLSGVVLRMALFRNDETDALEVEMFAHIPEREYIDFQQLSKVEQEMIKNNLVSLIEAWRPGLASRFEFVTGVDENEVFVRVRGDQSVLVDFYTSLY